MLPPSRPARKLDIMNTSRINLRAILGWAGVLALLTFPVFSVSGALDMFLKLGTITGESTHKSHPGEIDVLAWSWGMSNSGTTHISGGAGAGKANVQDVAITKYTDRSSPEIMLAALKGTHFKDATLSISKIYSKGSYDYLKLEMKDILVTSISNGGSGGEDRLTENVTLNFASFRFTYIPLKSDGLTPDTGIPASWNILENTENF